MWRVSITDTLWCYSIFQLNSFKNNRFWFYEFFKEFFQNLQFVSTTNQTNCNRVNQVRVTILIFNNFLSVLDPVLIEMLKTDTHLWFSSFWVSIINSFSNSSHYILQKCLISCFKQEDKGKYLNDKPMFLSWKNMCNLFP